jgi:hypothetical protein
MPFFGNWVSKLGIETSNLLLFQGLIIMNNFEINNSRNFLYYEYFIISKIIYIYIKKYF